MKKLNRILCLLLCLSVLMGIMTGCQRTQSTAESESGGGTVTCVDDLDGKTIAVQLGTTGDIYASDYEGDDAGTAIERYNKGTDAVQALKQGKADCVIIDEQPAQVYVSQNSELRILEEAFAIEDYAICISKGNTELKDKIDTALSTLKENGTLNNIMMNYVGEDDVKGTLPYEARDIERPNGTLVMATNAAFKPYEYYENGAITGIDADMMQAVCDELGMTLQIEDMEFDSIITAVQSGKADVGAAGLTVTEDRLKNIDFTQSYTTSSQVIIVKDGNASEGLGLIEKFKQNFIEDNRYQYLLQGLVNTLVITFFAVLMGIVIGFIIAIIRTSHDRNGGLTIANALCKLYLTVVRGTPVVVQLLIIYYVIFASVNANKVFVAVVAFGLNSGAYVAEVIRSGIMAIDIGQFEAGRSLGLNYRQTMTSIIMPQAVKNILPALCNEFISLLKETSISGYIGLVDLTKGGDIIRSNTYEAFLPLIVVALIYLVIVVTLTTVVNYLERRLRGNER